MSTLEIVVFIDLSRQSAFLDDRVKALTAAVHYLNFSVLSSKIRNGWITVFYINVGI